MTIEEAIQYELSGGVIPPTKYMQTYREQIAEWLEQLKTYKDAEEQGLLLRLPCKVGTDIYYILGIPNKTPCVIESCVFELTDIYRIGETLFLTKEEAEQKLADETAPRFLLDEYSICYGCPYYKKKNEVIYDHTEEDYDENGGCCDVHCVCVCGSMNTYSKHD